MLNHAFLIIAHDSPELLKRIINNVKVPNHYVFIHLDKNADQQRFNMIQEERVTFIDNIYVTHGGFSLIMAEIMLMKAALKSDVNFDYFHLISGHDYLCRSMSEFDSFFELNNGRSYMHYDSDEQHEQWKTLITNRYVKWNLKDKGFNKFFRKAICYGLNRLLLKNVTFQLYAGWQWFSWHRTVVEYVLREIASHPTYLESFRYTNCCDEVIFHTMFWEHLEELNIDRNNSLRYIDWFPKRKYVTLPLILDERDYVAIKESKAFFCRKVFIDRSVKLLDLLDADIDAKNKVNQKF